MKICQSLRLTFHYKVDTKKEKLEDFKTAISSTVRSLSNSQEVEVFFGTQTPQSKKNVIRLINCFSSLKLTMFFFFFF